MHTFALRRKTLLRLSAAVYLEAIATDPFAPSPDRPGWFGLNELHDDGQVPIIAQNTSLSFGLLLPPDASFDKPASQLCASVGTYPDIFAVVPLIRDRGDILGPDRRELPGCCRESSSDHVAINAGVQPLHLFLQSSRVGVGRRASILPSYTP